MGQGALRRGTVCGGCFRWVREALRRVGGGCFRWVRGIKKGTKHWCVVGVLGGSGGH